MAEANEDGATARRGGDGEEVDDGDDDGGGEEGEEDDDGDGDDSDGALARALRSAAVLDAVAAAALAALERQKPGEPWSAAAAAALALSSLARVHRDVRLCGRPPHRSSAVGRLGSEELFARRVDFDGTRTVEPCATATTANASRRCDSGPETRGDPNRARLRAQHEPDLVAGV